MKYHKVEIENFKGIREVILPLTPSGASIYTLIGLNESGKTTILEAINHHSTDSETLHALYGGMDQSSEKRSSEELATLIPKSEKADFSDTVLIAVTYSFEDGEKMKIVREVEQELKCVLDPNEIPDKPKLIRRYIFEDSDFKELKSTWNMRPTYRSKQAKKWKFATDETDVWKALRQRLQALTPQVAYFPTFLFNQPDRIYLTPHADETQSNLLYRQIIENIAGDLVKPLDIQRHLVERLINEETWVNGALSLMGLSKSKSQQITAAKNEMSSHLTRAVFDSWSKTFGGDFGGREILLSVDVEVRNGKEPLVYATFEIKDEGGQYEIKERSLGFRWFFSFILFTLFGVNRVRGKRTLFLLDEPASNLHSRAQMQLLESFKRITGNGNQIIYSTHSHYMINPDWLDQAFIVSNSAIDYNAAYQNDNVSARTNISAQKYRDFVGQNPDRITYFQPVIDKLNVALSKFDINKPSVLVEGKGDYRLLEYGLRQLFPDRDYSVVPTRGASGMDELIGLFLGWSVPFMVVLDDDKDGRNARDAYLSDWGLEPASVITLETVSPELTGKSIEAFLTKEDVELIAKSFGLSKVKKGQIALFFSELLASDQKSDLSPTFSARVSKFHNLVKGHFDN